MNRNSSQQGLINEILTDRYTFHAHVWSQITGYTISLSWEDTYVGIEVCVYFEGTEVNRYRAILNRIEVSYPLYWFATARAQQPRHP